MRWQTSSLLVLLLMAGQAHAADRIWTGPNGGDFYDDANWDTLAPQGAADSATLDNDQPAVIGATAGDRDLGGFILGTVAGTGGVVQNGGTLNVVASPKSYIGRNPDPSSGESTWIMNNNAALLYDDPTGAGGGGLGSDGTGQDLELAANGANARMELHNNAVLRISDDLKIAAEGAGGTGHVLADGNSQITVGSGIAVTEAAATASLTVAGNSLVVTGNSAGPGDFVNGRTDEGYLTLSVSSTSVATVDVKDNGKLYARSLQQRDGTTTMTIEGSGQFHVFDVFENAAPDLGNATVVGSPSGPQRTSHVGQNGTADTTIIIKDQGIMTVDSALEGSSWSGLALSGGTNSGGNGAGGKTLVDVSGQGTLRVNPDLHVGIGTADTTDATLKVTGPNATVQVVGDLRFALQPGEEFTPSGGRGALQAVITGGAHSTIDVGGTAELGFGELVVEFSGYSPKGGESYTLITAGSIPEDFFSKTLPPLPDPLAWTSGISGNSYVLGITGSIGLQCDLNGDGAVDAADAGIMFGDWGNNPGSPADKNGDDIVDAADAGVMFAEWTGDSATTVPEPATGGLLLGVFLGALAIRRRAATV